MSGFLFRAQDQNMTNGDFAFFTFSGSPRDTAVRPWNNYDIDPKDLPRRRPAFYALKQVHTYYHDLR